MILNNTLMSKRKGTTIHILCPICGQAGYLRKGGKTLPYFVAHDNISHRCRIGRLSEYYEDAHEIYNRERSTK